MEKKSSLKEWLLYNGEVNLEIYIYEETWYLFI